MAVQIILTNIQSFFKVELTINGFSNHKSLYFIIQNLHLLIFLYPHNFMSVTVTYQQKLHYKHLIVHNMIPELLANI